MSEKIGKIQDTNVKYSVGKQLLVTIEQTGYNMIYYWVSAFLTIYYTDVIGIAPATVAGLLLGVRIFDAINDPIIGSMADRTKSRFGRYRPWVFVGGIALSILMVLLFNANPEWNYGTRVAYMYAMYILVTVASTCVDMSYSAMLGVMTSDGDERGKIMSKRMMFAQLGSNLIGLVAVPLVALVGDGNARQGYLFAVLITCCVGLPMMIISSIYAKEVVKPSAKQTKMPLKKLMAAAFSNPPAVMAFIGFFVVGIVAYGRMAMYAYYFTYVAGNAALFSIFSLVNGASGILGSGFLNPLILKRVNNKGKGYAYMSIIGGIFYAIMFFFPAPGTMFFVLAFIGNLIYSSASPFNYAIIPDAVDYGEHKTGIRADGFISAFQSFCMKVGGAVGPAIMVALIGVLGYIPNQPQTPQIQGTLNAFVTIIPGIIVVLIGIAYFFFYKFDKDKHAKVVAELQERKAADNAEVETNA